MSRFQKEVSIDELINYENKTPSKQHESKITQNKPNEWEDNEDENYAFRIVKENKEPMTKSKTGGKKKVQVKGWEDFEAENHAEKEEVSNPQELTTDQPKMKIFKKPTGQSKPSMGLSVTEEAFPNLGEERPEHNIDREFAQIQPSVEPISHPSRHFINTKKQASGEHFAPIGTEEPLTQQQDSPEKIDEDKFHFGQGPRHFVHNKPVKREDEITDQDKLREDREKEINEKLHKDHEKKDSEKIHFSEGPRHFVHHKPVKREDEITEQDKLRLERERHIEELIQREKEEIKRQLEDRKKRQANRPHHHSIGEEFHIVRQDLHQEEQHHKEEVQLDQKKKESQAIEEKNIEEKKLGEEKNSPQEKKLTEQKAEEHNGKRVQYHKTENQPYHSKDNNHNSNSNHHAYHYQPNKNHNKPQFRGSHPETISKAIENHDEKPCLPKETEIVVTKASTKEWGEGTLLKKPKKKDS